MSQALGERSLTATEVFAAAPGTAALQFHGVLDLPAAATLLDQAAEACTGDDGHASADGLILWLYSRGFGIVETSALLPCVPASARVAA